MLFKVGGKMFVVIPLEPARVWLTLKADPEEFAELTERPGILPAPYLARAKWVSIETRDVLTQSEVSALLRKSYELVFARLPERVKQAITSPTKKSKPRAQKARGKKPARRKKRG